MILVGSSLFRRRNVGRDCINFLQLCVAFGLLTGFLFAADLPTALPVRVTSEMVPAGGTAQIKFFVDSPASIVSGSVQAVFDSAVFDPVRFVSVFSATGDAFGSAEPKGNSVNVLFQSPSGGVGRSPSLPILTIQVPVKAGISIGTNSAPQLSVSTTLWTGLAGQSFTAQFSAASVTIGEAVAVTRLHPGAGLLPAGTVISVDGTGFKPGTLVHIEGVASDPAIFIDSSHLQVLLLAPADLQGKHVSISNLGQPVVDFFPDLQGAVDGVANDTLKDVQPIFPKQQFLSSYVGGFVFGITSVAVQNTNLVPVDLTFHTEIIINPSLDRKVALAPGSTLVRDFGAISASNPRAYLYLYGSLPVSAVRVAKSSGGTPTQTIPVAAIPGIPPGPISPQQEATALEFLAVKDKAAPLAQSAGLVYCSPTIASMVTEGGGNWLRAAVEADSFTGTRFVIATVSALGLDVGIYRGGLTITCPETPSVRQVQVVLRVVSAAPQLMSDTPTVFLSVPAVPERATTNFTVSAEGLPADFLVTSDSPWLTVERPTRFPNPPVPYRFTAPQTITLDASSFQLAAGTYHAALAITPVVSGLAQPLKVAVDFTVASSVPRPQPGPPLPVIIVNAASGISGPVAAGEIVTIFGLNLGPDFPYTVPDTDRSSPPSEVGGTAIRFNGVPGPILFSSPTQVNVIVPTELRSSATAVVAVEAEHAGSRASAGSYPLVSAVPGIFTVHNQDGSLNSASNPAPPGSTLRVFVTGITFAPNAFLVSKAGSFTVPATYAGPAAGQFAGEVTLSLPPDVPPGEADLLLAVDFTGLRAARFRLFVGPQN